VLAIIVATVLLFRAPHRQYRGLTIEPPPVYVEPIPERPVVPAPPVPNPRGRG
jgi:hypothetical protein